MAILFTAAIVPLYMFTPKILSGHPTIQVSACLMAGYVAGIIQCRHERKREGSLGTERPTNLTLFPGVQGYILEENM